MSEGPGSPCDVGDSHESSKVAWNPDKGMTKSNPMEPPGGSEDSSRPKDVEGGDEPQEGRLNEAGDAPLVTNVDQVVDFEEEFGTEKAKKEEGEQEEDDDERTPKKIILSLLSIVALAALGLPEGYTMGRCGICDPQSFRDQMEFKTFLLIKLFMSAVGCSMFFQGILSLFAKDYFQKSRFYSLHKVSFGRSMLGCFILGVGMYIAGSGPTMAPSQLGSGVGSAPFVVLGLFIGGLLFALFELPFDDKVLLREPIEANPNETSVDGKLGIPYAAVALPGGVFMVGAAVVFEVLFPHENDVARAAMGGSIVPAPLNPIFSGLVIGLNQVPIRLLSGTGAGGSACVMNVIGTLSCGFLSSRHKIKKVKDASQLVFVYVGTALGALFARYQFDGYQASEGFPWWISLIGATVTLFGSRFAFGCTCGHGVSGMAELSFSSIAAAMCIFGGGIVTGLINVFLVEQGK